MARNNPVKICVPKHSPKRDPKFHHVEIFAGAGKSTKALFIILISGWVERRVAIIEHEVKNNLI
jgi:hypothetical protein